MNADERRQAVRRNLQDLCSAIARTHGLSGEQAEELYGHMEDKALAYMSGDETLSEEDLTLLVREHFGDMHRLREMFGPETGSRGLAGALATAWPLQRNTDIWGTFHFPWTRANRLLFPVCLSLMLEGALTLLVLFIELMNPMGWNTRPSLLPVWPYLFFLPPLLAAGLGVAFYFVYAAVGSRMDARRAAVRHNSDLETEGIVLRGILESPGFIQKIGGHLVLTPLVGEPLSIPLASITAAKESKWYNGTRYFGDNAAFALEVNGHGERIGIVVPRPGVWRAVLNTAR